CEDETAESLERKASRRAECDTRAARRCARDSKHLPRGKTNRLISMALGRRERERERERDPRARGSEEEETVHKAEPEVGSRPAFPARITTTREEFG
ncbi:unnamed protein product, partial [Ixodes hexagonus]